MIIIVGMKIMIKFFKYSIFIAVFLCAFVLNNALAQKEGQPPVYPPSFWFGPYGGVNINMHSADFRNLPNTFCCSPGFQSGSGIGYSLGGLFILPFRIEGHDLRLDIRLGYNNMNADLIRDTIIGNTPNDNYTGTDDVESEHKIESVLGGIGLDIGLDYYFIDKFYGTLGLRFGYLLTGEFSQQEMITKPNDVTFLNGSRLWNVYDKREIPELNKFQFGVYAGLGYDLPIGDELYLTPEARFYYNFTNISNDTINWKPHFLYLGAALKIPIIPVYKLPYIDETEYVRDTMLISDAGVSREEVRLISERESVKETKKTDAIVRKTTIYQHYEKHIPKALSLNAALTVTGIAPDGTRQKNPTLVIEEIEAEEGFPLLPYVFFRSGSAGLDGSGLKILDRSGTSGFDEQKLPWNTLAIYSDMLNILGSRMKELPDSKITVTGCNNNLGSEENNMQLSQDRANAIKNYLVDVWDINPSRIAVRQQGLPTNPSNNMIPDGQVENQRAEISSDNYELLKYLTQKDVIRTSTPPRVEIVPEVTASNGLKSWDITIEQDGALLRQYAGEDLPGSLNWNVEEAPMPALESPVTIKMTAIDNEGNKTQTVHETKISQLTINKKRYEIKEDHRIERFSLILFDFDKATLTKDHNKIISDINSKIEPESKVTVYGYTDRIGTPEYNKQLADRRIQETRKLLNVKPANLKTVPVGSDMLLYPNETPQGRCYSRTVKVDIETPMGK
mgnify:CR=1 FL=1